MQSKNKRPRVLITGTRGLVGSYFVQAYQDEYQVVSIDVTDPHHPIDITNQSQVKNFIESSDAQYIIHFAAFTDVSAAWNQMGDTQGSVYAINVLGTKYIAEAAKATGKHLIHISTAYVFDGEKTDPYTEQDATCPIEWYGVTKTLAEEEIMRIDPIWTILRIDQPFRAEPFAKLDAAHRIIDGLKHGTLYPQFTNHFFGPTFIEDFSAVIAWVLRTQKTGLLHASSGEQWTDFEFAQCIKELHGLEHEIIEGDLNRYLENLERPYQKNTALDTTKLRSQTEGIIFHTVREALALVKHQ